MDLSSATSWAVFVSTNHLMCLKIPFYSILPSRIFFGWDNLIELGVNFAFNLSKLLTYK